MLLTEDNDVIEALGAACAVMEPALQALQAAHRKGIVHRWGKCQL